MPTVAQGGTVRVSAIYRDASNALVDPTTPTLEIRNPSDVVVATGLTPLREAIGEYYYDYSVPVGAELGTWIARFSGVIQGYTTSGDEEFVVVVPGSVAAGEQVGLVSLADFKLALGKSPAVTADDAKWQQAIDWASVAVENYTERQFGAPQVTEARRFSYDGSGTLEIDDAISVASVSVVYPNVDPYALDARAWVPKTLNKVYAYIDLPTGLGMFSPAMGFEQNLDVWASENLYGFLPVFMDVTATWGWPYVPADVQQAVIWTAISFYENPGGFVHEAIENYSRTIASSPQYSIPNRARELLAPYLKLHT
jgi:hypothetical protein